MHHLRVSLYALMLAAAGIPLYIHLPQFASINLGIGLGTVGVILMVIRVIDLVQDPLIGWAIDRWPKAQLAFGLAAAGGLAIGFPMLFLLESGPGVTLRLVAILILLFTAYSLGTILLYGRSASLAVQAGPEGLVTLAAYREGGTLVGVIFAAIAPAVLVGLGAGALGYPAFGVLLGGAGVRCCDPHAADLATACAARGGPFIGGIGRGRGFAAVGAGACEQFARCHHINAVFVFRRGSPWPCGACWPALDLVLLECRDQRTALDGCQSADRCSQDASHLDAYVNRRVYLGGVSRAG